MFYKLLSFKKFNSSYTQKADFGTVAVGIPKVEKTAAELNSWWNGLSSSTSIPLILAGLTAIMPDGIIFPFINPNAASQNLQSYPGFTAYATFNPGLEISEVSSAARLVGYVDSSNNGILWSENTGGGTPACPGIRYNGTFYSFGYSYKGGCGIYQNVGASNTAPCHLGFIFFSSDNILFFVDLYYDKNNSTFKSAAVNVSTIVLNWLATVPDVPTDPYADGGESGPGGSDGDFDFSSTDIPIPSIPSIGAMNTGFISLYAPNATQLRSLANYLWAGAFDVNQFKKIFADPMDAILGLHIIPTIAGHPATGSGSLLVGNIDTGLTMPTVLEQYYSADFGTVNIPAKWGAYLDYSPYTKLSLYLPYIGFVPISPDDCMRGSINVVYHVDILSGTCVAFVYCYSNRGADGHTLYIFNGSCSCDCPVTSGQYRSALEGLLGVAGSIGRVAAGDVGGGLKDAISNVTAMLKPEIGRSGSFGGAGGLMGIQYPYLVLTVPRMCIPGQQNTFIGYPSFVTKTIGDLKGYTSIDVSHLNNMPCTESETAEIISLLGEGVIL